MATDTAIAGGSGTAAAIPYGARLGATVLLLALFVLGHLLPLPMTDPAGSPLPGVVTMSPLVLGLTPLVTGFILIELFSFMTSPGQRLRKAGAAGRARLNRAALAVSLLLAAAQAVWMAAAVESYSNVRGTPLVTEPGLTFRLLTIFTLTAATAAVFVLGQLLSAYGIGNGFALLVLAQMGWAVAFDWMLRKSQGAVDSEALPVDLLVAGGVLAAALLFIRRADTGWLPAFPQSALPVPVGLYVLVLLPFWLQRSDLHPESSVIPSLAGALVLIPLLSWAGFHLFSSPARLAANVPETGEVLDELAADLRRQAWIATAALTLVAIADLARRHFWPSMIALSLVDLAAAAAITLDLWAQFRFQRQQGPTVLLTQIDNVQFSYRLEERLQEEGIDALARGHLFRSLYFFFGPLFKIDVLVAPDDLDRARKVLVELEATAELTVF
jgi:hypothetical protein